MVWLSLVSSRPLTHPEPYLPKTTLRLYLNTFRGEPAISGFDWHFTPTHSSSQPFVPDTGSVLHPETIWASTWPWVAHPVSGLIHTTHQTYRKLAITLPLYLTRVTTSRHTHKTKSPRSDLYPSGYALFRLAFASAPELIFLNQLHRLTRRLILQ